MMPAMDGFETAQRLRRSPEAARIPILLLTARGQVEDRIRGFDSGADSYVVKPVTPRELVARVRGLIQRAQVYASADPSPQGRLFAFLGAKEGLGTTTVAVNAAVAFAQQKTDTILVDLQPWSDAVVSQLGVAPRASLATFAEKGARQITQKLLEDSLECHVSGVRVLAATHRGSTLSGQLGREQLAQVFEHLESAAPITILDLGNGLTPTAVEAVKKSDLTLLVVEPDPVTLDVAGNVLELLEQIVLGGASHLGVVIVNRAGSKSPVTYDQLEKQLGPKLFAAFEYEPEIYARAAKSATPIMIGQPDVDTALQVRRLVEKMQV
jgi:MinD-like ATPase involved in chromosome partitioning or flagellar assembly